MAVTADVVVVGAGVVGASTAYELARRGRSVVVVDRASAPGQGSTSASSAVVRFNYSTWAGVALSWESKHCWEKWGDHLEAGSDRRTARFCRVGMAFLDVDLAPLDRVLPLFDRAGVPYEHWDAPTLAQRLPGIDPGRYWPPRALDDPAFWDDTDASLGALFTPDAGYVDDPSLAALDLADAAVRRGARLLLGRTVTAVLGDSTATGVLLDDGTEVLAPVVVNAAGPWSGSLNRLAGVGAGWSVTVRPMRQEVHHVQAPPSLQGLPVLADLDLGTYVRPTAGGGLLVGGTEPECDPLQWLDDPDAANTNPTRPVFEAQVTRAARRLPDLGVPQATSGTAGVYDVTEDWAPVYDRTERDGFFVAIGTSGNQFKNAPVVGKVMAAVIDGTTEVTGEHTGLSCELSAFSRLRPRGATSGTVMG